MLDIKLMIDGEEKTFTQLHVPFVMKRKALELEKYTTQENADPVEYFDKQSNFMCELFGKQFSKEEFENGFNATTAQEEMFRIVGVGVIGYPTKEETERRLGEIMEEQKAQNKKLNSEK